MPVCVGIGATKTLAKLANAVAKKQPGWDGVCDLGVLPEPELVALFERLPVQEVWGIGRRLGADLEEQGIKTVADLRAAQGSAIRQRYSVVVERTVRELRGESCLSFEDVPAARQQIQAARSFGGPVLDLESLLESVRAHVTRAVEKLRQQGSVSGRLVVFLETNRFRPGDRQYHPTASENLPTSTDDVLRLTAVATRLLRQTYRPGYKYNKLGVQLQELREKDLRQGSLFDEAPVLDAKRDRLMGVLDAAAKRWGRGTVAPGTAGLAGPRAWGMKRESLSPAYTTRWEDLPVVRA
jgi:DNA polymerase V